MYIHILYYIIQVHIMYQNVKKGEQPLEKFQI